MENFPNQWVDRVKELERFRAEVRKLVDKAEDAIGSGYINIDYFLFELKAAFGDPEPVTRHGEKCLEEVCDGQHPILEWTLIMLAAVEAMK